MNTIVKKLFAIYFVFILFTNCGKKDNSHLNERYLNGSKIIGNREKNVELNNNSNECIETPTSNNCIIFNDTESKSFHSDNIALEANNGSVAFIIPEQTNVTGPKNLYWDTEDGYKGGSTDIYVKLLNNETGNFENVVLTGQRYLGYGFNSSINNAVTSYEPRVGTLYISFDQSKNSNLKEGNYTGEFYVQAKGWHDGNFTKNIKVFVSIEQSYCNNSSNIKHCIIYNKNQTKSFRTDNIALEANSGSVAFFIPPQKNAVGPDSISWGISENDYNNYSKIAVKVTNLLTRETKTITLLGRRFLLIDGKTSLMNDAIISYNERVGNLEILFDISKNLSLSKGKYRGKVLVKAQGWHDSNFSKNIPVYIDIEI